MRIGDLANADLRRRMAGRGVKVQLGPFTVRLRIDGFPKLVEQIRHLHTDYPVADRDAIADFHVRLGSAPGPRRWLRPQVRFYTDQYRPFQPLPAYMALAALEWGINWCIATRANRFLMLHAAVAEREGRAAVFPAWPGHGKTTLCAGLMLRGWRLLSDEFGLLHPLTRMLVPLPRLLPLKNASIEVIRAFSPKAVLGPTFPKTRKGDVAHLKPTRESVDRAKETAVASLIVFPRWQKDASLTLEPMRKSQAFLMLATNAFNYEVLGEAAFRSVERLVKECPCYSLVYSDLDEAVKVLSRLLDEHVRGQDRRTGRRQTRARGRSVSPLPF
jgi:HprK-related kinase A